MSDSMSTRSVCELAVRPSKIHGKGVFATRRASPKELIFATTNFAVLPNPSYESVQRRLAEHIVESRVFRWVNHSCCRNAEVRFVRHEIQLVAMAEIQPDDEVVCDYMLTEDSIPTPFLCNCGHCASILIG